MPEMGCFVFPFSACPAQGPLLSDTAEEFLFAGQIKVNHAGAVMKATCGGHLLWGHSMAVGKNVEI